MNLDSQELLKKYEPKEIGVIVAEPQVASARFSPCGKLIAAGAYDGQVRRWNMDAEGRPELPALTGHHGWIEGFAFRAEGELLFTGDSWGQIRCWPGYLSEKPEPKWKNEQAHNGWIRTLALSPDGKRLASIATDKKLKIWSADDGALLHEVTVAEDPRVLLWHPGGGLFLGDAKGLVELREAGGDKPFSGVARKFDASVLFTLSRLQDCGGVACLALDAAAKQLAVGGLIPKNGGTVIGVPTLLIFNAETGEKTGEYSLGDTQDAHLLDVHFHPAGFLSLVTSGTPGKGQLLFLNPSEKTPFFSGKKLANCHSLSWRPDGQMFAVAATNTGSNGNGRPLDKDGKYKGNNSPIHLFQMPASS